MPAAEKIPVTEGKPVRDLRQVELVLRDIVSLATDLREEGVRVSEEEALPLVTSARTLLRTLGSRDKKKETVGSKS